MAWKERTVEQMREEFVKRVLAQEQTKTALCKEYGISRPTGDLWLKRYQAGESLTDNSRAPQHVHNKVSSETEELIVSMRKQYPALGALKLHRILQNEGHTNLPCVKTVNNILKRNNLIPKAASAAATPYQRFEKTEPNAMWQADFKGHFLMQNGNRCHPLNIIDDCSRYNLCCEALEAETFEEVMPVMLRIFREYGMPSVLLCDNGNPWGTAQSTGFTRFEVFLMELGILTIHGRALHPQTQGKEERFNRSFKRECLEHNSFPNTAEAQEIFNQYRSFYNEKRPHCALDLNVPSSRYKPSQRKMPDKIQGWEYGAEYTLHKVKDSGYITYKGQGYFLSEAFSGKTIGIRESHLPGQVTLVFRQFRIGRIDPDKRVFTLKRAYLLHGDPRQR